MSASFGIITPPKRNILFLACFDSFTKIIKQKNLSHVILFSFSKFDLVLFNFSITIAIFYFFHLIFI